MKSMKIKKVGEHLTRSFSEWKQYINEQQQITTMRKHLVPAVDNVKDKLNSLNDKFLGERGLYHGISSLRNRAKDMKESMVKLLKSKQIIK